MKNNMIVNTINPKTRDIVIHACKETGDIYACFQRGENLNDFQDFQRSFKPKSISELTDHLDSFYEKGEGWFMDKFINNGVCCALDAASLVLHGVPYGLKYPQNHLYTAVIGSLIWCAYLAQVTGSKEVPEIYHKVINGNSFDLLAAKIKDIQ
jgi:hypothetical protein